MRREYNKAKKYDGMNLKASIKKEIWKDFLDDYKTDRPLDQVHRKNAKICEKEI